MNNPLSVLLIIGSAVVGGMAGVLLGAVWLGIFPALVMDILNIAHRHSVTEMTMPYAGAIGGVLGAVIAGVVVAEGLKK